QRVHQRRRERAAPRLRRVARRPGAARAGRPVPPQRHGRGQRRRPPQATGDGARSRGRDHRGQARLRAVGADLLWRVRRPPQQARAREGDRRMSEQRKPAPAAPAASTIVRGATPDDLPRIWQMMLGLADYERMRQYVTGTRERLGELLFGGADALECRVAEHAGHLVGYTIFYTRYSSFRTARRLWLEDLVVDPA